MARDLGPPRRSGAPTDCTPEITKIVIDALREGNYRHTAAAAAGIHRITLTRWEAWGVEGREPYATFLADMVWAEAMCVIELLREVRKEKGAAWILERLHANDWSTKIKQGVAEQVDALTDKLKADPELHRKVVEVLSAEAKTPGAQH